MFVTLPYSKIMIKQFLMFSSFVIGQPFIPCQCCSQHTRVTWCWSLSRGEGEVYTLSQGHTYGHTSGEKTRQRRRKERIVKQKSRCDDITSHQALHNSRDTSSTNHVTLRDAVPQHPMSVDFLPTPLKHRRKSTNIKGKINTVLSGSQIKPGSPCCQTTSHSH